MVRRWSVTLRLNLPAYCHFTSPIRRLADLINHRIVKARLRGQDSPYSKTELEQLGKHIGQVTRDLEQATADYFKEKHQELYQTQVQDTEELSNTSEKEFSKLLKYAIDKQELESLIPELQTKTNRSKTAAIRPVSAAVRGGGGSAAATGVRQPERECAGRGRYHLDGRGPAGELGELRLFRNPAASHRSVPDLAGD